MAWNEVEVTGLCLTKEWTLVDVPVETMATAVVGLFDSGTVMLVGFLVIKLYRSREESEEGRVVLIVAGVKWTIVASKGESEVKRG